MLSWSKDLLGAATTVFLIFYCIGGLIALCLLVLLALVGADDWFTWFLAFFLLVFSAYRLFFLKFYFFAKRYKMLSKVYGVTEWLRTTEFTDEEIILSDHNSVCKLKYDNIKRIKEKGNNIIIYFNDNLSARLYKDAFVEGTWEECKAKINSLRK